MLTMMVRWRYMRTHAAFSMQHACAHTRTHKHALSQLAVSSHRQHISCQPDHFPQPLQHCRQGPPRGNRHRSPSHKRKPMTFRIWRSRRRRRCRDGQCRDRRCRGQLRSTLAFPAALPQPDNIQIILTIRVQTEMQITRNRLRNRCSH